MDIVTTYHAAIEQILAASGVSDKMMHMHVGMAIFLCTQVLMRSRRGSVDALLVVAAAEAFNEIMDRLFCGSWQIWDTTGDVVSTLFWPTAVVLVSRYRRQRWTASYKRARDAQILLHTIARNDASRTSRP